MQKANGIDAAVHLQNSTQRALWRQGIVVLDILHSEFDASGYVLGMARGCIVGNPVQDRHFVAARSSLGIAVSRGEAERLRNLDPGGA